MLCTFVLFLTLALASPAPPAGMPDAGWQQLRTAEDSSPRFDEGALYPLLRRAMDDSAAEAGATVPDYRAIAHDPAQARGQRFLIEGRFAGRPREVALARPGPWGDTLTEWGLLVDDAASPPAAEVVLVYVVDPAGRATPPRPGQRLRLTGRFYKVWQTLDLNNQPTAFLTFIAPPAPGSSPIASANPGRSPSLNPTLATPTILLILIALGLVAWRILRTKARPRPTHAQHRRDTHPEPEPGEDPDASEPPGNPLPDDPAEALAEMQRRRDEV